MLADTRFKPVWFLPSAHAQTLATAFWTGELAPYQAASFVVQLADGDQVVVHDDCPPGWAEGGKCVLLGHGLSGDHQSPLLNRLTRKLTAEGVRVFRWDMRGAGASQHLCIKSYNAGCSDDLATVIDAIIKRCQTTHSGKVGRALTCRLTLIGVSISGNILLKYLGESRAGRAIETFPAEISGAIAVNPPIDLAASVATLTRPLNRLYDRHFVKRLSANIRDRQSRNPRVPALPRTPKTLFEFDDIYTAPVAGYRDAADYYQHASANQFLSGITIPTRVITSHDDPMVPINLFDHPAMQNNPALTLIVADGGGHVGISRPAVVTLIVLAGLADRRTRQVRLKQTGLERGVAGCDISSVPEPANCVERRSACVAWASWISEWKDTVANSDRGGKVLCAGIIVVDHIAAPIDHLPKAGELVLTDKCFLAIGGCASNVAIDLAKQDIDVRVTGKVGVDSFGDFALQTFARCGIDTAHISRDANHATSQTLIVNVANQDRRFIHHLGANQQYSPTEVTDSLLDDCRVLYVGGFFIMDSWLAQPTAELFRRAKARGITILLDVVTPGPGDYATVLREVLPVVDVFMPNVDEAELMTGLADPSAQADQFLAWGVETAIIKLGGEGCLLKTKQSGKIQTLRSSIFRVPFVDGTGAVTHSMPGSSGACLKGAM